jgi:hypothetical protein
MKITIMSFVQFYCERLFFFNCVPPEGKRPLGRPRRRWVDNIKMDLRETGWDGVDWIGLIWLRIGTSGGLL